MSKTSENVLVPFADRRTKNPPAEAEGFQLVGVTGFEPATSCSQSRRATNCATPRNSLNIITRLHANCKVYLYENEKKTKSDTANGTLRLSAGH